MNFILIQFIGAIGYATLAASYFKKEKKKILFMQIIGYVMFTIHYYLLSGVTGAICNLIGLFALVTIYLSEKYNERFKKILSIFFIILLIVINIATFQNVFSIFPLIASVIVIISFLSDDENVIRKIGVVAAVCWLIYAIVYKSYVAIVFEAVTFLATVVAFIKNNKTEKQIGEANEK